MSSIVRGWKENDIAYCRYVVYPMGMDARSFYTRGGPDVNNWVKQLAAVYLAYDF